MIQRRRDLDFAHRLLPVRCRCRFAIRLDCTLDPVNVTLEDLCVGALSEHLNLLDLGTSDFDLLPEPNLSLARLVQIGHQTRA